MAADGKSRRGRRRIDWENVVTRASQGIATGLFPVSPKGVASNAAGGSRSHANAVAARASLPSHEQAKPAVRRRGSPVVVEVPSSWKSRRFLEGP
jgi:hypothetical protein